MLKSKASRTTNEVVRETFSIKRCQSSIAFKEGESAQRILTLVAVVAAGGSTGIVAGSSTGGGRSLAPLFPNNLRIHHAAGNHLTATITLHFGQKTDMDRLDYLRRDSFYTGVSEGNIGSARIIKMLDVKDDHLVVESKGIYSIDLPAHPAQGINRVT